MEEVKVKVKKIKLPLCLNITISKNLIFMFFKINTKYLFIINVYIFKENILKKFTLFKRKFYIFSYIYNFFFFKFS